MKDMLLAGWKKRAGCSEKTSLRQRDYQQYQWKKGERIWAAVLCAGVVGVLSYFFYRSLWAVLPLSPIGAVCFLRIRAEKGRREREELVEQFRECILAVTVLIQAGYSVENAFLECDQDMRLMYGADSLICQELKLIRRGLHISISLEELLSEFGVRSHCQEIIQFAEIFDIAKRNGGNLPEIIDTSSSLIGRKIETKREINVLLGAKRMELSIMKAMPFAICIYLELSSGGYFDNLYHNVRGEVIMTVCLLIYLSAYAMSDFILNKIADGFT